MRIAYADYYIPEQELSVDDLLSELGSAGVPGGFQNKEEYAEFVKGILNVRSIRHETKLDEYQMIARIVTRFLQSRTARPDLIDAIIFAEGTRCNSGTFLKLLQADFNIEKGFSLCVSGNECINFEIALGLASSLLQANQQMNQILIVSTVKLAVLQERIVGSYGIMGDAAGIMLVTRTDKGPQLLDQVVLSTGSFSRLDPTAPTASLLHCKFYMKALGTLLERNSSCKSQIAHIIVQNANPLLITQCIASVGLSSGKIFQNNFGRYGHLHCLDFVVNLVDLVSSKTAKQDELILTFGMGWNGSYIASLLKA